VGGKLAPCLGAAFVDIVRPERQKAIITDGDTNVAQFCRDIFGDEETSCDAARPPSFTIKTTSKTV